MVCKFVICVKSRKPEYEEMPNEERDCAKENVDFFECVAFGHAARQLGRPLLKGTKVVVRGQMRNFMFYDANNTAHFTNIVVAEQVEYRDLNNNDLSVMADLKENDIIFNKICSEGFLCVDEDDYYRLATLRR